MAPGVPPGFAAAPELVEEAAPVSTPTTHFARSVLVEDDRDVNLCKHGKGGNIGQFSDRSVPRRSEFPYRTGSTARVHAPVLPGTASGRRRSLGRSLLRRIPLRKRREK
jgi:hypothetical protein